MTRNLATVQPNDGTPAMETNPTLPQVEVAPRERAAAIERERGEGRLALVVVLLAGLADVTVYRGEGFAGVAVLLVGAPLLMCVAALRLRLLGPTGLLLVMLALLAAKLVWCGSVLAVAVGLAWLAAFAMSLSGQRPYVIETVVFASQTIRSGYAGLGRQWAATRAGLPSIRTTGWPSVVLPLVALAVFGMLFVLANPDLMAAFGESAERFFRWLRGWLLEYGPRPTEVLFWLAVIWVATGALRPLARETAAQPVFPEDRASSARASQGPAALYAAYRNTLIAVVALFAVYLVFEFRTLWFREFPPGFHYSGYAHEGAFWLTVTLALATAMLSVVFRGSVLHDARLPVLRRLAWIWSAENFLLAIAVYHRLWIYVGFNGMTRLRVVGFLGISAVVAGFVLVLVKIARRRDFVWLVRRQLWALALFVYLYAVLPIDMIVMRYNVERILVGDPAPSVQITVQPIDAQGLLMLPPLLDAENETIGEGVRAVLSQEHERLATAERGASHWTAFQWAERRLGRRLRALGERLRFASDAERAQALRVFSGYAYRWY
jgi:Domain of unknown function (DUF4173)